MKRAFLFLIFLLVDPIMVFAHSNNDVCRFGWGSGSFRCLGCLGIFIVFILVFLIGSVIYFIIKKGKTEKRISSLQETPLDILKKRYAKGEISKEEFEQMKKDLVE